MKKSENATPSSKQLDVLRKNFPSCFDRDGKFDMLKLQDILSEDVEFIKEGYSLNWLGKKYARILANTEVETMLVEDIEHNSIDINKTSNNLYIEGDNLEVLKHMKNAYNEKIKMIYIDPPYNTGSDDFAYNDTKSFSVEQLGELANVDLDEAKRILEFVDKGSNSHSAWLTFMYPRLYIARQLLKEDGVIFISIDDNEQAQLKILCDEVFGEENFISECARIAKRTSNKGNFFKPTKDYILSYGKSKTKIVDKFGVDTIINLKDYKYKDEKGLYKKNGASLYQPSLDSRPNQRYYIECPDGSFIIPPGNVFPSIEEDGAFIKPQSNNDKVWRWSYETYLKNKDNLIFTKASNKCPLVNSLGGRSKYNIYDKVYLEIKKNQKLLPEDVIYDHVNSKATKELLKLKIPFSYAKPTSLIEFLLKIIDVKNDDIILDFFSGSASTAHAVINNNLLKGMSNKFIMIQLPEPINGEEKEFYDFCVNELKQEPIIPTIAKERIKRAANLIKEENKDKENIDHFDCGFKVFKTKNFKNTNYLKAMELCDTNQTNLFNELNVPTSELYDLAITWKTYDGVMLDRGFEEIMINDYKGLKVDNKLYLMYEGFNIDHLSKFLEINEKDDDLEITQIVIYGYNFTSEILKGLKQGITLKNKKGLEVNLDVRY